MMTMCVSHNFLIAQHCVKVGDVCKTTTPCKDEVVAQPNLLLDCMLLRLQ